jgi:ribosomal protein S18 acetylase RimI-like enzyme
MLSTIDRSTRAETVAYLARKPYENAYLRWLIESGHQGAEHLLVWRDWNGAISGVVYFGPQIVIASEDPAAVDAFAIQARRHPAFRMVVGPPALVERFCERVQVWSRPLRARNTRQPLFVVTRETLRAPEVEVPVRLALADETPVVAENAAAMMLGELGYDPLERRPGFAYGVGRLIDRGWWWVWFESAELRFMLNVGALTDQTMQLQGVWTPPAQRRRGYATLAMGAICARLLQRVPSLSLHVNDFNANAVALYRRLGFYEVGELATYLFVD